MHIGILSDPNNFHTRKWVKGLEESGARVTVFSFDSYSGNDLDAVRISPTYRVGKAYSYLSYLNGGKALSQALKEKKINIVNALNVTPFGVWAMQADFHPLIVSALGADILEYPPPGEQVGYLESRSWGNIEGKSRGFRAVKQNFSRAFYRGKVKKALEAADLVTGDNQHLLDRMTNWFGVAPEKMRLLRYGVEPELFSVSSQKLKEVRAHFGIPEEKRVVLSPRGAKAIYQADIILESFKELVSQNPDWYFIMLSAGYEVSQRIREDAEQLMRKCSNFYFEPSGVPREKVYALWNLVDIFISAPVYDGYSAAVAEGRYIGAIPVVNDIPGNREVIVHGENGWIVDPFDARSLTGAMKEIMADIGPLKNRFAGVNRSWIEENSLLKSSADTFIKWCDSFF